LTKKDAWIIKCTQDASAQLFLRLLYKKKTRAPQHEGEDFTIILKSILFAKKLVLPKNDVIR